jgi:hypothetical protein
MSVVDRKLGELLHVNLLSVKPNRVDEEVIFSYTLGKRKQRSQ